MKPSDYPVHLTSQESWLCIKALRILAVEIKHEAAEFERQLTLDEREEIENITELVAKLEEYRR